MPFVLNPEAPEFYPNLTAAAQSKGETVTLVTAKNIPRPQLLFKDPIDNSDELFKPRITDKPNSKVPLELTLIHDDDGKPVGYEHPYKFELESYVPPAHAMEVGPTPTFPFSLEDTTLTIVDTEVLLAQLLDHLENVTEIAVDVEHHSYRSYQGFACIIQISTDEGGDFIVDALALREHLHKLNKVFTNPEKIKVFHGAENDVLWLQRDFGVYLVGIFDTHQAARLLQLNELSLKYLLQRYCSVEIDKTHQMADWRVRPLPEPMVIYARLDTHYLLYIWRVMRRQLLEGDAAAPQRLQAAFDNSQLVCGMTYKKPVLNEDSHLALYKRSDVEFNAAQMTAFKLMYRWRDRQARILDESTNYLLPNRLLFKLAQQLPREVQGITALCQNLPPFVKQNVDTLHQIILSSIEMPDKPRMLRLPGTVVGKLLPPLDNNFMFHDYGQQPHLSDVLLDLDMAWEAVRDFVESTMNLDVVYTLSWEDWLCARSAVFSDGQDYVVKGLQREVSEAARLFVEPINRFKIYRYLNYEEELKYFKEKEARIAAISKSNEFIHKEVIASLRQTHAVVEYKGAASGSKAVQVFEPEPGAAPTVEPEPGAAPIFEPEPQAAPVFEPEPQQAKADKSEIVVLVIVEPRPQARGAPVNSNAVMVIESDPEEAAAAAAVDVDSDVEPVLVIDSDAEQPADDNREVDIVDPDLAELVEVIMPGTRSAPAGSDKRKADNIQTKTKEKKRKRRNTETGPTNDVVIDLTGESVAQTSKNKKNNDPDTFQPFSYRNVSYGKFYSNTNKGQKHPKTKFKET